MMKAPAGENFNDNQQENEADQDFEKVDEFGEVDEHNKEQLNQKSNQAPLTSISIKSLKQSNASAQARQNRN